MIKRLSYAAAVGLFVLAGCRADDRTRANEVPAAPAPEPTPEATAPPAGMGGGPATQGTRDREGAIDRLAQGRCEARERCGNVGTLRDHASYSECVAVARAELRGSFGAATCESYDDDKLAGCARKLSESPCGKESQLSEECVESALCTK